MAAFLNLDIPSLEKVCAEASREGEPVQVANDNCPGQVVISGAKAAVERAMTGAKAAGAKRAIPLAVSIAAHSNLMDLIQGEWNDAVNAAGMKDARFKSLGMSLQSPFNLPPICAPIFNRRCNHVCAGLKRFNFWRVRESQLCRGRNGKCFIGIDLSYRFSTVGYPLGNPSDFTALE